MIVTDARLLAASLLTISTTVGVYVRRRIRGRAVRVYPYSYGREGVGSCGDRERKEGERRKGNGRRRWGMLLPGAEGVGGG